MKKYAEGKLIRSVADFERSSADWYIVNYGGYKKTTTHRGWLISWQFKYLENMIKMGWLHEAKRVEGGGENETD